ncbi:hypothetical protein [Nocardioides sp. SLBN-35]|uniref:hypothetical protein n=1 Tax=Nocardioides sp. SLBN-35 TaxID=2768445 RepID=UPI001154EBE9|nr:hypothetical protein [Nocardioides sp. SLBN-35]TQK71392.1 hypothetical protein FBY23_3185 [Nocardioides sp. SLBN-35]
MLRISRKKAVVLGGVTAVVLTGGVAFAYWTSTGEGTGTASTGTSTDWVVTVDDVSLADLTPDGPTDTVTFHVTNDNSGVQQLQNTVASVTGTSDPDCTAADFDVSATTIAYGDIAAGDTVDGTFTIQMVDTGVNQDACKGVTVDLKVAAS